jgi:MFS family permease
VVIQSHVIAMYLPSLFTGAIILRFGVLRVMLGGLFALLACAMLALVSQVFLEFWGALVLLGVGWNFLFVGATVLLTRSYRLAERFKAQAVNDFSIFSIQALASLSAGTLLFLAGWQLMSLVVLVPLILLLGTLVVMRGELADPSILPAAVQGD